VAVVGSLQGRPGLKRLWLRFALQGWHVKWLAVAFALPLFLLIPVWLLERSALALGPITAVSIALAFLVVGEEVGWRGFALPYLLERWPALWSRIGAGIGVGIVWALWHLPNFFLPGYPHQGLPFTAFFVLVVAYSILFTWLHLRTGGNLSVAVVFHAALNLFSLAGVDPERQYWWKALTYSLAALVVTVGTKKGER
jgi:membrane protease YdiL (CAAX protease family)